MQDDLEDLVYKTCVLMGLFYMSDNQEMAFKESMRNIHLGRFDAQPSQDPFKWYLEFRAKWEALMEFLGGEEELSKMMLGGA